MCCSFYRHMKAFKPQQDQESYVEFFALKWTIYIKIWAFKASQNLDRAQICGFFASDSCCIAKLHISCSIDKKNVLAILFPQYKVYSLSEKSEIWKASLHFRQQSCSWIYLRQCCSEYLIKDVDHSTLIGCCAVEQHKTSTKMIVQKYSG